MADHPSPSAAQIKDATRILNGGAAGSQDLPHRLAVLTAACQVTLGRGAVVGPQCARWHRKRRLPRRLPRGARVSKLVLKVRPVKRRPLEAGRDTGEQASCLVGDPSLSGTF